MLQTAARQGQTINEAPLGLSTVLVALDVTYVYAVTYAVTYVCVTLRVHTGGSPKVPTH